MTRTPRTKADWQIQRNRLEKAANRAGEILGVIGGLRPPIDPFAIAASEESITVIGDDFKNRFDGQLEYHRKQGRFLLFYNSKYDVGVAAGPHHPRTRFSVAHELGHFYLDAHHAYLRRGGAAHGSRGEFTTDVMIEREADAFAAALLLPAKLVRPLVNQDELSLVVVKEVATQFNTSLVSTAIRCVSLSDFPCAVVGLRDGVVAWTAMSSPLIDAGFYPPARGSSPSRSTRERWSQFQAGDASGKGSAFGKEWFRTYDRDDLERVHVTEHYLPVQSMETLVVLLSVPEDELASDSDDDDF